jgi:SAM-dependent methyltransferase
MFNPAINYRRDASVRDTLSLLPRSHYAGKQVLDFGCGSGPYRRRLEGAGARWIGLDLFGEAMTVCGDGHCLPFRDECFDIVLSEAVFEHLVDPRAAAQEIGRVLRPGGYCIGYVAFLEPYHASYFHHSHRGIERLLASCGLVVKEVLPGRSGIECQLENLLFPRPIPMVATLVRRGVRIFIGGCKRLLAAAAAAGLWLKREPAKRRKRKLRLYRTLLDVGYSGGLLFTAVKPHPPAPSIHGFAAVDHRVPEIAEPSRREHD